jgi:predicted small integral membrane protein
MSTFESSFKSLLQGVSQQIARERQPGQVTAQENMLSDPVTNVRRRPGAEFKFSLSSAGATASNIKAIYTDIANYTVHVVVNTSSGTVTVMDKLYATLATLTDSYLIAADSKSIQLATVGDEIFMLNKEKQPTQSGVGTGIAPDKRGMFFIAAGAFSKAYVVSITTSMGTITATYSTPTGAAAGDAALATPVHIATQLSTALASQVTAVGLKAPAQIESYIYLESLGTATNVTVNSSTGSAYIMVSKDSYFTVEGNLPAQLHATADGWIVRVGDIRTPKYFKYVSSRTAWLESGDYNSPTTLASMPISLVRTGAVWALDNAAYEGRLAGDDLSNPPPRFIEHPITGVGAYQGRLVLLCGSQILMSASSKPRRFYRSTITSILDSDPIAVGASANTSAAYEYAIPFQKDLLLFSGKYQALIPSGNTAITPRTATCVLTSAYSADMTSSPVTLGRTLMYPTPRSEDFFGVLEMVPSSQVDSQYVSGDSTAHLPKYLGGKCRFSVASSTAGAVLFAPSGDDHSLIVHEFTWDGDKKVQQAWHRWTFPYAVSCAYFANELIVLLLVNDGKVVGCTIDPRVGVLTFASGRKPFLDLHSQGTIVDNLLDLPAWLLAFDPAAASKITLTVRTGPMAGEKVGYSVEGTKLRTVRSWPTGDVSIGYPYRSVLSPSTPVIKDTNDVIISTSKTTLLRYVISTANSSEYEVQVRDAHNPDEVAQDVGTLYWSSNDLSPGKAAYAPESSAVVPCRTNVNSTTMVISTSGTGELNVVSLEYLLKFNVKYKRLEGRFK